MLFTSGRRGCGYAILEVEMARVPITVMGRRCERCGHPKKAMTTYEDFRDADPAALNPKAKNAATPKKPNAAR
jgi:hypothetical protein